MTEELEIGSLYRYQDKEYLCIAIAFESKTMIRFLCVYDNWCVEEGNAGQAGQTFRDYSWNFSYYTRIV